MGAAVAREAETLTTWQPTDLRSVRLSEVGSDGFRRSWIMYMPLGKFKHPEYGKLSFTRQFLSEIKRKFDNHTRGIDIALDTDHKEGPAPGWIERMELREAQPGHPAGLYALIKWTPYGVQLLKDQLYRYFSPEYGSHFQELTGKTIKDIALGGALTNRPFLKSMPSVQLAEVSHKPWGSIKKSCLPRSSFLIQGDPNDKSTWKLPIYEGAGPKDADGHYTKRGALNINAVRAALAAIGGARTGTPMSGGAQGLRGRLQNLLKRYGDGGDGAKAASEAAARGGGSTMGKAHGRGAQESTRLADFLDSEDEDQEVFEELDEDGERRTFAQSTTPIKSPTDWGEAGDLFDDGTGEDNMYADGADGNDDGDGFDPGSDTHGPAHTDGHMHGRFAEHPHSNDADHSDAPVKRGKSMSRKAAEQRQQQQTKARTLSEANRRLAEYESQVKVLAERAYREDVRKFSEALSSSIKLEGVEVKTSRRFSQAFEDFMFNEGRDLDDAGRRKVVKLIQTAYRYGPVMTSQYALTEPPEGTEAPVYGIDRGAEPVRRERRLGGGMAEVETGDNVLRLAEQIAQQRHKRPLKQLKQDEADVILSEAAQRGNYRGAETVRGR